jgi:hypothetical protein
MLNYLFVGGFLCSCEQFNYFRVLNTRFHPLVPEVKLEICTNTILILCVHFYAYMVLVGKKPLRRFRRK